MLIHQQPKRNLRRSCKVNALSAAKKHNFSILTVEGFPCSGAIEGPEKGRRPFASVFTRTEISNIPPLAPCVGVTE